MKKVAFSLHSRTTPWLRRTSQMLHLRKTEQIRTRLARFRRLIVFNRNPFKENTVRPTWAQRISSLIGNDDETSKALLFGKVIRVQRSGIDTIKYHT